MQHRNNTMIIQYCTSFPASSKSICHLGNRYQMGLHPVKTQLHRLNVLLGSSLSLDVQVSVVARNTFCTVEAGAPAAPILGSDLTTVTHTLVSCLDFCNIVYMGLPLEAVWKLQLIHSSAVRLELDTGIILLPCHSNFTHCQSVDSVVVMIYKDSYGIRPSCLNDCISPQNAPLSLRSSGLLLVHYHHRDVW